MKHYLLPILIFAFNCTVSCIDDDVVCFMQSGFYKGIPTISYAPDQDVSHYTPAQPILHATAFCAYNPLSTSSSHAYTYDAVPNQLSVDHLADYFHESSPQELFSKSNLSLLMSDAFVDYLKQFPEYEGYIEHFHEKFHKSSGIKQYFRKAIGHRLCQLHREIKADKKLKQAKKRAVAQRMKEMKLRDWVKQGTAFVVEGMLLHKVTQLTFNACSRLKPLFGELLRSAEYEEIIAACVEGERISLGGLAPEIEQTTMLLKEAEGAALKSAAGITTELFAAETETLLSLLEELETVNSNKVHHILQEHHMWDRICTKYINWDSVKELLVQTIKYGEQIDYKGLPSRVLKIGGEDVQVVYLRLKDGLKISNAWVKNGKLT